MDKGFKAIYTNSTFGSKLRFGLETWGGALKSNLDKVQRLQDAASKLALNKNITQKTQDKDYSYWAGSQFVTRY